MGYRVYHDQGTQTIAISGLSGIYPEGTLKVQYTGGDKLQIVTKTTEEVILGPIRYDRIDREDGTTFLDSNAAVAYLTEQFEVTVPPTANFWQSSGW